MVSGKAEAAYDAGAGEAYEHAFQRQQRIVDCLGPAFVTVKIHERSCLGKVLMAGTPFPHDGHRFVGEVCFMFLLPLRRNGVPEARNKL